MMEARRLIPMKYVDTFTVAGRCSACDRAFDSANGSPIDASNEVERQFDAHTCNEDVNQGAGRIVRESSER
jgi:hypothetical protein